MTDQLQPIAGQRLLFSPEIENKDERRNARYTAERFRKFRPEDYEEAVRLLGEGFGLRKIGARLGCHHLTVAAVRDRDPRVVDTAKQTLNDVDTGFNLLLERVLEHPDLVPWNAVGMTMDQLLRIRELLAGRATARVEHFGQVDVHANWEDILQTFVSEKELTADKVREIGFEPGEMLPIGAGAADPAPGPRTDEQSDALPSDTKPNLTTNLATEPLEKPDDAAGDDRRDQDPSEEGGGGIRPPRSHRRTGLYRAARNFHQWIFQLLRFSTLKKNWRARRAFRARISDTAG